MDELITNSINSNGITNLFTYYQFDHQLPFNWLPIQLPFTDELIMNYSIASNTD